MLQYGRPTLNVPDIFMRHTLAQNPDQSTTIPISSLLPTSWSFQLVQNWS